MLSKCGAFATRRNIQIQAKIEQKSSATCEQWQDPAKDEHSPAIAIATATASATEATSPKITFVVRSRLCAQQSNSQMTFGSFWVLSAVLIVLSSSLLPSTCGLPRRAFGRHLILPHRHHVHLRSAGQENQHKMAESPSEPLNLTTSSVQSALIVCKATRESIIELFALLIKEYNFTSEEEAQEQYKLHTLELRHPLENEVNNTDYDGTDTINPKEEIHKISVSLHKLQRLLVFVNSTQSKIIYERYFRHFLDKMEHNVSEVNNIMGNDKVVVDVADTEDYNRSHPWLEYAVLKEFINLLRVIELKYQKIDEILLAAGAPQDAADEP